MEDKIKEIFNKHWKTRLNGSINYDTMTSITEGKVLNEIWDEAQKELLSDLYANGWITIGALDLQMKKIEDKEE